MVKKKATARAISAHVWLQNVCRRAEGVCLLLPSMNFLGSSARSANTRVFCQYLCKYSKNMDKSHSKRIFLHGKSFSSGFLRGCCWSKCMENNRLPELSFVVFCCFFKALFFPASDLFLHVSSYFAESASSCDLINQKEVLTTRLISGSSSPDV